MIKTGRITLEMPLSNQALSCYGNSLKLLETPNIDRLAKEGMLFRRCMVPNSICGPSRAAILTGKYAHVNGFRCNGDQFDGGQPTFAKMLQSAGYQTAMIGEIITKNHHNIWSLLGCYGYAVKANE